MSLNKKAFTLIELLVTISIFSVLMIISADFIIKGFKSITFGSEQETAIENARRALNNISRDLREAKISELGEYTLSSTTEQSLIWYGDIDNDNKTEKIEYHLEGNNFFRTTTEPGILNDYTGTTTNDLISMYVNNNTLPIFHYYDQDNIETSIINRIRLINIFLKINVTPAIAPGDYNLESDIQLRNLKDNP